MAKAYWIAAYREIHDPDKLAAYLELAGPAIDDKAQLDIRQKALKILADDAKASIYREDKAASPEDMSKGPSVFAFKGEEKDAAEAAEASDTEHERA